MTRLRLLATVAAAICLGIAAPAALTSPALAAGSHIGPNQAFTGLVNGHVSGGNIMMACFGPIHPGEMGHPSPGQYVEVIITPGPLPGGYTGSAADHIFANFVLPAAAHPEGVNITNYLVKVAIPTTFELPCSGSGIVSFIPLPTSPSARSENVSVHYTPQP